MTSYDVIQGHWRYPILTNILFQTIIRPRLLLNYMVLGGLGKTWKDMKVFVGTWKDLNEFGKTWKDMERLERGTLKDLEGLFSQKESFFF